MSANVALNSHFESKRAIANGITSSGSGMGSGALPLLLRMVYNKYQWTGVMVFISIMIVSNFVLAIFFKPHNEEKKIGNMRTLSEMTSIPEGSIYTYPIFNLQNPYLIESTKKGFR